MPEKISIVQVGGSVETALRGDYHIDVRAILTEAWQLTLKSRLAINLGLLFSLLLGMSISLLVSNYLGGIEAVLEDPQLSMLLNIVVTIAVWPFIAGVEMMGVLHSVGMKTHMKMTFSFLQRASWVVLCALFTSVLISLGFQLFILPGIFLAITLSLTIPLVIEKKMTPMKAITISIQALRFKFLPLFVIYFILLMSLVMLFFPLALLLESTLAPIGIMIFIFGSSYLAPLFYNTKGILYREIFGISLATDKSIDELEQTANSSVSKVKSDSDDTFSA
ncbi:MAG: hypothetical protein OQK09_00060 [Colwellia sp.]|nr:hypothetical protein [Colwellia sp.]MCW8864867.1 hypothetical protein [Colwellia sp.]MCW9079879.1 hypothetical protein [Colwellia sp.]